MYRPPVIAQAPIAITYFGSGIWSYTILTLGAIFLFTVPCTTIRSHCLKEPNASIMPNLSTSYLGPEAAPNSTLQHAVSRWTGHSDHTLPQFIAYPSGASTALTSTSLSLLTSTLKFVGLTSSFIIIYAGPLHSFFRNLDI